jgi:O-antigen ligase/tetratricopeptide (TPR) repeat protein
MSVVREIDPDRSKPLNVVIFCLVVMTVFGACLLTSGPFTTMEGAKDWSEESPLRALVHVLNLSYTQTTAQGVAIKWLVFGLGASVAAFACGVSLLTRPRESEEWGEGDRLPGDVAPAPAPLALTKRQIPPLAGAQVMLALFVAWSFLSAIWARSADMAIGGSILLAIGCTWALVLGRGLNRSAAHLAAGALRAACVVTAIVAILYFGERNPTRRASYPVGNPLFLAAVLIPGFLLGIARAWTGVRHLMSSRERQAAGILAIAEGVVSTVLVVWAISLTSSRSGAAAAGLGVCALAFFAGGRRAKLFSATTAIVMIVVGLVSLRSVMSEPSPTGRDATLRLRYYAWSYASEMIEESMLMGHGQGGFTLSGDRYAVEDVLDDPLPLGARIAHAHNEWLETWADLGLVGIALVLGSLTLTLLAGVRALPRIENQGQRWMLVALMASLVALIIEECADNALRIAGFPTVFYTVIGLIWALSRQPSAPSSAWYSSNSWARRGAGVLSIACATVLLVASVGDFQSARAYAEIQPALATRSFDDAVKLADTAAYGRLSPQRRLEALERACSTHLYIAREYQISSIDRATRAHAVDPADANLLALAESDLNTAITHANLSLQRFEEIVRRSPTFFGVGWLEYRLYQLQVDFARATGDEKLAARHASAAVAALDRELSRRPYDAMIALTYVREASTRLTLDKAFEILARPLRYDPIPPHYNEYLASLSANPKFDDDFAPIWDRLVKPQPDDAPDPWVPEKLRLTAVILLLRGDYEGALNLSEQARRGYASLDLHNYMATAACTAELADYQFFADISKYQRSIALAREALELLPDSTRGREMRAIILSRLVFYHLAGGDEAGARTVLDTLSPGRPEELVNGELGAYYAELYRNVIRRVSRPTDDYLKWLDRAETLNPKNELVWRMRAQLEYEAGHLAEAEELLRRALAYGADIRMVASFVEYALSQHPDNTKFKTLREEIHAAITGTGRPVVSDRSTAPLPRP